MSIRGSKRPLAIIRVNPCSSVAKKTSGAHHLSSRLHVSPSTRTRTRGLPSAARLTENRTPKTEHRKPNLCVSLRAFAALREPNSLQSPRVAQPRQNRTRAGTHDLYSFVSIRGSKRPLRLSVIIRVHPWQKNVRGTPPALASSRLHVSPSTWTRTRGLPSAARLTEHRKPNTELVRFPSRLRGFA